MSISQRIANGWNLTVSTLNGDMIHRPAQKSIAAGNMGAIAIIIVPLLLLFIAPFVQRPEIYAGDEPHYLIVANSLRLDGDLELKSDYPKVKAGETRAGKNFAGLALDHHIVFVDRSTSPPKMIGIVDKTTKKIAANFQPKDALSERTIRAVGWPAIIAFFAMIFPFLEIDTLGKILSHLSVLGTAVLVGFTARRVGAGLVASVAAGFTIIFGSSYWVYANTVFAEPLLGLCLAGAIYCIVNRQHPVWFALALVIGAWTKFQFYPVALVLGGLSFFRFSKRAFWLSFAICILGAVGLAYFNLMQYGHFRPPMPWFEPSPIKALHYFFVDSQDSILMRNPWLILVIIAAVVSLLPGFPRPGVIWWLLAAVLCIPTILWGVYDGGYCYPGRLLMPLLIPAAIYFAFLLESPFKAGRLLCFALLLASMIQNFAAASAFPAFTWRPILKMTPMIVQTKSPPAQPAASPATKSELPSPAPAP